MGNTLSSSSARMAGMANLVSEVGNDVQYDKSIGSSRFLRAIRAKHRLGPIVVKTFIKPDPSMSLSNLVKRIRVERESLADVPNVLTYQKVVETEKAGYLIRQWLASNLYDRISTRPFLTNIEKKWITYQLLHAMRDAHGRKIPHGDLKCENVLVTGSLMVYVTDFASSFKPTYLPLDDPSDFSFFFDTSGRRTCYVAPERFYGAKSEIANRKASAKAAAVGFSSANNPYVLSGTAASDTMAFNVNDPYAELLSLGKRDDLVTEAMDVFSLGCVIAELWRDGAPTFTLSQLFKYRQGLFDLGSSLSEISDSNIRDLVRSMISLDPSERKTFDQYLMDYHEKAFPSTFYDFFHQYLVELQRIPATSIQAQGQSGRTGITDNAIPAVPKVPTITGSVQHDQESSQIYLHTECDERIERLFEEWSTIIGFFQRSDIEDNQTPIPPGSSALLSPSFQDGPHEIPKSQDMESINQEAAEKVIPVQINIPGVPSQILDDSASVVNTDGIAVIVLSVILANLRNCVRPSSKCHALDLLLHLSSRWLTDETKLDRVIPYVISLLDDESVQVRMAAIRACTQTLMMVKVITPSNAAIFPEFIMPNIKHLSLDPSTTVRCVFASCIVALADTGERYLQMAQAMRAEGLFAIERDLSGDFLDNQPDESNYDAQLKILQTLLQEQIVTLLTDPSASVKRALIANIAPLCSFFGMAKTNDVLLSHMITYLNDRNWLLREAFFETIVSVAKVTGNRSLEEYILPLMTQALSDTEEHVVTKVLNGLQTLIEEGLFERTRILALLEMTLGFLCHPNIWLREACAGLVAAAAQKLDQADLWAIVYPSLRPLLKADIYEFSDLSLLDAVKEPLSRPVFQAAIGWASKASKTLFWKPAPEGKDLAGLKNGLATEGVGLLLAKSGRDLFQTAIGRTEEDDGHLDKLRSMGMDDDDLTKLVALRGYIRRLAKQSSISKTSSLVDWDTSFVPNETPTHIKSAIELQSLEGITPQTIFFSTVADQGTNTGVPENASIKSGTFRSQDDSSFSSRIAKQRLVGQRITSEGSAINPISEFLRRRMISNMSMHSAFSMNPPPSTPNTADPHYTSRIGPRETVCQTPATAMSAAPTQARLGVGKATAAVAPSHLNATGMMTDLAPRLKNLDAASCSHKTTPVGSQAATVRKGGDQAQAEATEGPGFTSTYDGNDPYIKAHLEAVYFKSFRDRPEFGPRVHSGPPRRGTRSSALPTGPRSSNSKRRPEGKLIAYFTEHTGPITCVAVSPDHLFFVSGSEDGTLKVWDTTRLEKNVTSRSRATYSAQKGRITSVIAIENSHCVASTATDGSLHVWRVDVTQSSSVPRYAKPKLVSNFQLSTPGEYATCLIQSTTETTSNLILGTSHSRLTVLDLRTMQVLQTLRNPVEYGPITCLCVDKKKAWMIVGTLGGVVSLWDLRFALLLKSWRVGDAAALGQIAPSHANANANTNTNAAAAREGIYKVNRVALHPSKGRGRWILVAAERIASFLLSGEVDDRNSSPSPSVDGVKGKAHAEPQEVLIETWDIDKGIRVETFENGGFPRNSGVLSKDEERPSALTPAVKTEEGSTNTNHNSSDTTTTTATTTENEKTFPTWDNGAAAAIERLLSKHEASGRRESSYSRNNGTSHDQELIDVREDDDDDDEEDNSDKDDLIYQNPNLRTGGSGSNLRSVLRPIPSERSSAKALFVSLDGYTSSSLSASSGGGVVAGGGGPISGGWLDAGKLVSETDSNGGITVSSSSSSPTTIPPTSMTTGIAGYMLTAGEDRKIRFWDLGKIEKSVCIGTVDEKSEFKSFSSSSSPIKYIHQLQIPSSSSSSSTSGRIQLKSPLIPHPQTQYTNQLSRIHKDAILTIAVIEFPFRCIVVGDRSGCLRVWE